MAGHTPGPWQYVPDKWDKSEYRIETVRRWSVDPASGIYVASADGPTNARLIAAAPDLWAWMGMVLAREPERFTTAELNEAERIGFKVEGK